MTPEQKAIFIQAQTIESLITALGMISENLLAMQCGTTIPYNEEAFNKLIISPNYIINFFRD